MVSFPTLHLSCSFYLLPKSNQFLHLSSLAFKAMRITGQLLYLTLLHESLFWAVVLIFSYSPFINKEICNLQLSCHACWIMLARVLRDGEREGFTSLHIYWYLKFFQKILSLIFNCCDNQALRKIKSFLEQSLKNSCKWRKSIGEKATGCYQIAVT